MEIPEAKEIAEREIIESERKLEAARVKEDMKADGLRIQAEEAAAEQKRKDNEKKVKRRARKYSAIVIQAGFRAFVAKRITRERAYKRYKKYFDKTTMNYFYEDVKTHRKKLNKVEVSKSSLDTKLSVTKHPFSFSSNHWIALLHAQ